MCNYNLRINSENAVIKVSDK